MKKLEDRPWWNELVQLKDVLSLRELAERYGAAPAAISNALKRAGFERVAAPSGPRSNRDPELIEAARAKVTEIVAAPVAAASTGAKAGAQPKSKKASAAVETVAAQPKARGGKAAKAEPVKTETPKAAAKAAKAASEKAAAEKAAAEKAAAEKAAAEKAAAEKAAAEKAAAEKAAAEKAAAEKAAAEKAAVKATSSKAAEKAAAKAAKAAAKAAKAAAKASPKAAAKAPAEGRGPKVPPRLGTSRLEAFRHLLGKVIDREIAAKAGVSVSAVTNFRKRHDIPSASASTEVVVTRAPRAAQAEKAAPVAKVASVAAPAPVAKVAPPVERKVDAPSVSAPAVDADRSSAVATGGDADPMGSAASSGPVVRGFGYRVVIDGQGYVVVAADIAGAARAALASGQGAVTEITLLGSAIG